MAVDLLMIRNENRPMSGLWKQEMWDGRWEKWRGEFLPAVFAYVQIGTSKGRLQTNGNSESQLQATGSKACSAIHWALQGIESRRHTGLPT